MIRCTLALLLVASAAHAGGFGIPEIGVRRTAMGAVVGRPDDLSALYHNPAGLVLDDDWTIYISSGVSLLGASFQLAPWDNGRSSQFLGVQPQSSGYYKALRPSRAFGVIPMIAVGGRPLPRRLPKLHVAAGVYVGNAQGAAFPADAVTRYHLIDAYVIAPQAVFGAAYEIAPAISIGATIGVLNVRIHDEQLVYPVVSGANIASLIGSASKLTLDGSGWAPCWSAGLFGRPHPRITWGAAVIGRVDPKLGGPITLAESSDAAGGASVIHGKETSDQLLPWTFQAGANVDVTRNIEIGTEFRYWLYRQFQDQYIKLLGLNIIDHLDSPKDYHDSQEVSGGVRVHDIVPRLDLMAGMQYDHSPAPPETLSLSSPSFTHFGLHSGLRYTIGRYRIGASYIHYWYEVPVVTDSITSPATNFRGHGSNNIITASLEVRL